MDHLLTDYAVQIRNRMKNQAERALSQAKKITPSGNGSVYYDPFPLGVIFKDTGYSAACTAYSAVAFMD